MMPLVELHNFFSTFKILKYINEKITIATSSVIGPLDVHVIFMIRVNAVSSTIVLISITNIKLV